MENEIIQVKQLPIIEEQLHVIKAQFEEESKKALSLECTEDTYKEVKNVRANLTKIFNDLETKRTSVRRAILTPYDKFNAVYKECITDVYQPTKSKLDAKISEVEDGLKNQKEEEVESYFKEYIAEIGIDFLAFKDMHLNITLNASKKSLKDNVKAQLDKVTDDLAMIDTQEFKEEILVEYKQSLNVSQAILNVNNRHKAIEEEKARREAIRQQQLDRIKAVAKVEEAIEQEQVEETQEPIQIPIEEPTNDPIEESEKSKIYQASFRVRGSIEELRSLKNYIEERGLTYERI